MGRKLLKLATYVVITISIIFNLNSQQVYGVNKGEHCNNPYACEPGKYDWDAFTGKVNIKHSSDASEGYVENCEKQIARFFTSVWELSPEATSGIMGNIQCESGFDPSAIEGTVPWSGFVLGGTGIGLTQLTWGEKQAHLGDMAYDNNLPWTDMDLQLNNIAEDLESVVEQAMVYGYVNDKIKTWEDFKQTTDIQEASTIWLYGHERCGGFKTANIQKIRGDAGKVIYQQMNDAGVFGEKYEAKNNPPEVYNNSELKKGQDNNLNNVNNEDDENSGEDLVEEWELEGMPSKSAWMESQNTVPGLTQKAELKQMEQIKLNNLDADIKATEVYNRSKLRRQFVTTMGFLLCLYGVVLFLAYIFDLNNPFFTYSLLSLLSFRLINPKYENRPVGQRANIYQITHQGDDSKNTFILIGGVFVFGMLLCTGGVGIGIIHSIDMLTTFTEGAYKWFGGLI